MNQSINLLIEAANEHRFSTVSRSKRHTKLTIKEHFTNQTLNENTQKHTIETLKTFLKTRKIDTQDSRLRLNRDKH